MGWDWLLAVPFRSASVGQGCRSLQPGSWYTIECCSRPMSALSARTILQYSLVSALRGSRLTENAKLQLVRLLHDFVTRQSSGALR